MILLLLVLAQTALPIRPDPVKTPGDVVSVTLEQICTPGYSASVRNVPTAEKEIVFFLYGLTPSRTFEIDHLVSLELGGSNDEKNLWPQSYTTVPYNAYVKDSLENKLHWMVCHHAIELSAAQKALAQDWIAACHTYDPSCPKDAR